MRLATDWEPVRSPWRGTPEDVLLDREAVDAITQATKTSLTRRERAVLSLRLREVSLYNVGELLGCTGEAVRQQQDVAVEKIRAAVTRSGPTGRARLIAYALQYARRTERFFEAREACAAELRRRAEIQRVLREVRPPSRCQYECCPRPMTPVRGRGTMHRACISERHRLHMEKLRQDRAYDHIGDSPQ